MKKKTVTVFLENDLIEKIKKEAKKRGLSVSAYIRMFLIKELEKS